MIALALTACASTPKAVTTQPSTQTPAAGSEVTDVELQAARDAIAEAEAAGAAADAPDLLSQAKDALKQAEDKAKSSPDTARTYLKTSIEKAHEARDTAYRAQLARADTEARQAINEAKAAGAEKLAPSLLKQAEDAQASAAAKGIADVKGSLDLYRQAVDLAHQARDKAALTSLDQKAQDAIAKAESVNAAQYAPTELAAARTALQAARDAGLNVPNATPQYNDSIDKANAAYDASLKGRTDALLTQIDAAVQKYKDLKPDLWEPTVSQPLWQQADEAKTAVQADFESGEPKVQEALKSLDAATTDLNARLTKVQDLRGQVQSALADADQAQAYVWVPDLVQTANDDFFQGNSSWKKYRLDAAEESWSTALFNAQKASAQAKQEALRKQTELLMHQTMQQLEDASKKTVVDPQDNIISPKPWNGDKALQELKSEKPVSLLLPQGKGVAVLGDQQRVTYLDQAKELWAQGVKAFDNNDLTTANASFLQAQKLIQSYLAMAVDKIYTVRLIPDRRDSLWRISEYKDIYDSPFAWPKIWKRNEKLIQNPDLIYPGWQLIIPPQ